MLYGALLDNAIGVYGPYDRHVAGNRQCRHAVRATLTLEYNKARQSAITNELVEIVSGARLNG